MTTGAFLGIDGGGSTTVARLEDGPGAEVFERATGSTNPHTTPFPQVQARFDELLAGCPPPDAAAICLAGMSRAATRDRVGSWFRDRFPTAVLRLEPDYAAALRCFDPEPAICVIAGTGSVVCSRAAGDALVMSGGTGYGSDPGSASRLGRALVDRYADDPGAVDDLGPAIDAVLGAHTEGEGVAAAAPVLCGAAAAGHEWALTLVADEMDELAALAVTHSERHCREADLTVGLVGGVWSSAATRATFARSLRARHGAPVTFVPAVHTPQRAAVLLAREAAP